MTRIRKAVLAVLAVAITAAIATTGAAGQSVLRLAKVGDFDAPVYAENAPGAKRLLFVVEQPGVVRVLRKHRTLPRPFLDINELVTSGGESGLLSIAFSPDYQRSRRFYVYFTNNDGDIEIDEFKRSRQSDVRATESSRRVVLVIDHGQASNHNGGQLQFGPDGMLYIGTGDGGGSGDGFDNARHPEELLGKLLRIDPRLPSDASGLGYRIPAGNPYAGGADPGADEVYAYGLRNPWRFSFDGNVLTIGDVGQGSIEEVDVIGVGNARGANFGWPQYEGTRLFDEDRPGADPPVFPVHEYTHDEGGCTVTGGYVVHDPGLPALEDRYIYADFCIGELRSFGLSGTAGAVGDASLGLSVPQISSFGEGVRGQIYALSLDGPVYRLEQ